LQVGRLSFGIAHCNEKMHPLCLMFFHEMEKLCAMIEKFLHHDGKKETSSGALKNLWNEKRIKLKI
jgi:hypothetical protein